MYKIYKQNNNVQPYVTELIIDTMDDMTDLPTSFDPGSTCLVAEGSRVFVLNNEKNWVEL